jgi:hypothetical protein
VAEDQCIEDKDQPSRMEVLQNFKLGMTGDKARNKYNEWETSRVKYDTIKIEYIADPQSKQNVMDFGPYP